MRLVVVTGSRTWTRDVVIFEAFERAKANGLDSCHLIHGDAPGADRMAGLIASRAPFHWSVEKIPADWSTRDGGFKRNLAMLSRQPDVVVGFCREGSRGTLHTVTNAVNRSIPVVLYWQDRAGRVVRFSPEDCHRRYFGRTDPFKYGK